MDLRTEPYRLQSEFEAEVARSLPEFLPRQRWFGGKARRIASARAEDCVWLESGDRPCALVIARVDYEDGPPERYALLIALVPESGGQPSLGVLETEFGARHLIEAATSTEGARHLLRRLDRPNELRGLREGVLRFGDLDAGGEPAWAGAAVAIRPLGAEQSNTSLGVGDGHIFKLVRRLEAGESPELEIGRFLSTRTSFRSCPTLRGSITWVPQGGLPGTLGTLQDRVENEGDGWRWTLARLRDVFTQRADPAEVVEAIRGLGAVTAELHAALGSRTDHPAFAPRPAAAADAARWTESFGLRAQRVLAMLEGGSAAWSPETRRGCDRLVRAWPLLSSAARAPSVDAAGAFAKIRLHGDYHLGQTLRTRDRFVLIDFEGEPGRPLDERRHLHCALKDVAGMVRSFDYAIETARADFSSPDAPAPPLREAFLEGYRERATGLEAAFLPADETARDRWERFFELDKALYEVEYEIQNRPAWLGIPVRGMLRILGVAARGGDMNEPRRAAPPRATPVARRAPASKDRSGRRSSTSAEPHDGTLRVVIESVRPRVDDGRYAVKRTVGESLQVSADVFADGHDHLAVVLRHRRAGEDSWNDLAMTPENNDVWSASFTLDRPGFHEYTVEAWPDRFLSWRDALSKKSAAGRDVAGELLEGASLVREAAGRATGRAAGWLGERAAGLSGDAPQAVRVSQALDDALAVAMARVPDRTGVVSSERPLRVWADRERARFGAWYEMFPRSAGPQPGRGATLREAESRLPDIASMGFDVLYLPPIHPIGRTHRKGRGNTLEAKPGEPGSPWAIGAAEGGHTAVDPGLGTVADFDHFVAAAREHGLEVALDLAFQCSPDHPWVQEHPEWFRHRPDGTIQYAENPPKQYQDIFPLHFECETWRELWNALLEVVRFWIRHEVRIFRVDNPHTKPFRFWDWLIAEVQREHRDVIFLSEAFTRPRVMERLAKGGFTQSYTYFTWRNRKQELTEYFTELTATGVREYLRPNLFANTPDILHEYLQTGRRAAFQIRHTLAATLGASYGIYGPAFELCEGRAVPGTEEYENSEKYEVRAWDLDRPGHIREWIALLNRARREHPALQHDHRLRFHEVDCDDLIFFTKTTPDLSDVVLVVVNLDPHHVQHGWVHVPIDELGIPEDQPYQVHDLISDDRYLWTGARNYVRLDPQTSPAHVLVLRHRTRTERDFDYYV